MENSNPTLSVVIVNYNSSEYIIDCINSVFNNIVNYAIEVYVVDNFSTDDSVQLIERIFPQVNLIKNQINIGFAAANNLVLAKKLGRYVLILNPDVVIPTGALQELVGYLDSHPSIGMLSPKLVRANGGLDLACRRNFPSRLDIYFRLFGIDRLFPNSKIFAHYNLTYLDASQSCEVECIAGAFMLVRQSAINQVGLMDERFFMYAEDMDWSFRFKLAGWVVFYYANIEVLHYKRGSTSKEKLGMLPDFYKAIFQFYEKYYASKTPQLLNLIMKVVLKSRLAFALAVHKLLL